MVYIFQFLLQYTQIIVIIYPKSCSKYTPNLAQNIPRILFKIYPKCVFQLYTICHKLFIRTTLKEVFVGLYLFDHPNHTPNLGVWNPKTYPKFGVWNPKNAPNLGSGIQKMHQIWGLEWVREIRGIFWTRFGVYFEQDLGYIITIIGVYYNKNWDIYAPKFGIL